jgi:arylsulfatase A-like enzyme
VPVDFQITPLRGRLFLIAVLSTLVLAAGEADDVDLSERQAGFNLLLITLDTTRADRLGLYGYELALTPALDGLASRGVVFDQAFTNVPMTLPAHATIMTGLQPPEHGIRINGRERLDLDRPTLAEVLRDRGYQTGAFVASFTLNANNGLNVGFDVYDEDLSVAHEQREENQFYVYRSGKLVVDSALAWLAERDTERYFFAWVPFVDPHLPYVAHPELADTKFDGRVNYDAEIAFMGAQLSRLLSFLEAQNLSARTVVVAVGDHGEGLGQHGEPEHGYMLY